MGTGILLSKGATMCDRGRYAISLTTALFLCLLAFPARADGQLEMRVQEGIKKPLLPENPSFRRPWQGTPPDTFWVGYLSSSDDPNRVNAGGLWDFDTDAQDTDSTQSWSVAYAPFDRDSREFPVPTDRRWWWFDYGNVVNRGDYNLWRVRAQATPPRTFRRTGLTGVWHSDDMSGVSSAIAGLRSAWCGFRVAGDPLATQRDELTNNTYTSDHEIEDFRGGGAVRSGYPGYADQWDQMLYRDFSYAGAAVALQFKVRCYLSPRTMSGPDVEAGGWHTPDPFFLSEYVPNPADSLEVWIGKPRDFAVYDFNHRWLAEVIDFSGPAGQAPELLYKTSGILPANGTPGQGYASVSLTIPAGKAWSTVRVVFRVKTNRIESDVKTIEGGFNTVDGAVLIDDVVVGTSVSNFENSIDIRPRVLLSETGGIETEVSPTTAWITTGRCGSP